jgi:3-deoxy-7-phosphoheptulonate synthase
VIDIDDIRRAREPDATRLVETAVQSRDKQSYLRSMLGGFTIAAHEFLSIAYEMPFVRIDPETGKTYLDSAHIPWVGARTNGVKEVLRGESLTNHPFFRILRRIENTVGVKIGANSTAEHIQAVNETLNPDKLPGKVIHMVRLAPDDEAKADEIAEAIHEHAPESLKVFDVHGVTKTDRATGKKIRPVSSTKQGITTLHAAMKNHGGGSHGISIETVSDPDREECVEYPGQIPRDDGHIDPRFNPPQTRDIYDHTADLLAA